MTTDDETKRACRNGLSIVMPVYNEAAVIEKVIADFYGGVIRRAPGSRLIVVEDGSDDGTKGILTELHRRIPFTLISAEERKGYTRAFKDALMAADTELIFFSDSDGQHNPCDILKMLPEIGGCDIVGGYKHPRRDPLYRRLMSRVFNFFFFLLYGLKTKDINSGFKLMRKRVVDRVLPDLNDMRHCVMSEFMLKAHLSGHRIKEVPVDHFPRPHGGTNIFKPARLPLIIAGLMGSLLRIRLRHRKHRNG